MFGPLHLRFLKLLNIRILIQSDTSHLQLNIFDAVDGLQIIINVELLPTQFQQIKSLLETAHQGLNNEWLYNCGHR